MIQPPSTAAHSLAGTFVLDRTPDPSAPPVVSFGWYLAGCVAPGAPQTEIRIASAPFRVGRRSENEFAVGSGNVSGRHAEIVVAGDALFVRDVGSTNGTYVNGARVPNDVATPIGPDDLVQFADMEFRVGRREEHVSHDRTLDTAAPEQGWLISQLHDLLNHRGVRMVFQPILDIHAERTIGVEALVRSDVPGLENPGRMFAAAAQLGLEERVSQVARTEAVNVAALAENDLALFLNTHPAEHLGGDLVQSLGELRRVAGSMPIVLEVHESAVPDIETMAEFRAALRDVDVQLAYDDFGAGQSRLLELTRVPPDYLKFDRSLLQDVHRATESHQRLVRTLVDLVRENGVWALAEGLECEEEVATCRDLGFTHVQGYFYGRPGPLEEAVRG